MRKRKCSKRKPVLFARRHYVSLARLLAAICDGQHANAQARIAGLFVDHLKADNSGFKPTAFLHAAGLT